jgi:hypothetical protein
VNKFVSTAALAIVLGASGAGVAAAQPVNNVGHRHPNLEAAQRLSSEAYQKLALSRQANEFDEGGHALKAQELLEQANAQLGMAAQFLNAHGK